MGESEKVLDEARNKIDAIILGMSERKSVALRDFISLQGELKTVAFDKKNDHFGNQYASLTAITEEVRPLVRKYNFSIIQKVYSRESKYYISTLLVHSNGYEFDSGELELRLSGTSMQHLGSAITYARRYQESALLGIVSDEDDDGNIVNPKTPPKPAQEPKPISTKPKESTKPNGNTLVAQLAGLQKVVKKKGLEPDLVKRTIKAVYKKENSHHLDGEEIKDLIGIIERYDTKSLSDFVLELERQDMMNAGQ